MDSQNSFYVLGNLSVLEYPISRSTVLHRGSFKKLLLTAFQTFVEKTSVRVTFKEYVLAQNCNFTEKTPSSLLQLLTVNFPKHFKTIFS